MPIKENCFAYLNNNKYNGCYCLNRLYCLKENCHFYKTKQYAKECYLKNIDGAKIAGIDSNIEKFFKNL